MLFTRHLQTLINQDEDWHVQVHAVHPGVVDTDLFVHSSTTYVPWFKKLLFKVLVIYICFYPIIISFKLHKRTVFME